MEWNKHTDTLIQLNRQGESNATQFGTRLMNEYLPTSRLQSKWHTTKAASVVKVWILENNSPRGIWCLGLMTEVYPGSDNIVEINIQLEQGHFQVNKQKDPFRYTVREQSETIYRNWEK